MATRSPLSTFSADLMGVAHFLRERRLRVDCPELGGVGVDCTELVLAESDFATGSVILDGVLGGECGVLSPPASKPQGLETGESYRRRDRRSGEESFSTRHLENPSP